MRNYFLLLALPFFIFGCWKPDSEFNLKKHEYAQGEALIYENLSQNDKNSKWEILNENGAVVQSFEGANPNIVTGITLPDGVYTIKLTSYRKKEKRGSIIDKQFLLKSFKHSLRINNNNSSSKKEKDFAIYVDNQLIGQSNTSGAFAADIPEGLRIVKLVSPSQTKVESYNMNKTINITFNKKY